MKTSKLKLRQKVEGFTLIELLVVIAIIAILVVIVVMAINPLQILRDSRDRAAMANVRSAGILIGTCISKELELNVSSITDIYSTTANLGCGDITPNGLLSTYGTVPTELNGSAADATVGSETICVWIDNPAGSGRIKFNSLTGALTGPGPAITASCNTP